METLKQIIMRRDSINSQEADALIQAAKDQLSEYIANNELHYAENICAELFGLEPDYIYYLL